MRSRVMPTWSARIWATSNWVMSWPSQAARKSGENGPVPPVALEAMGARVMDSTPQAMARS